MYIAYINTLIMIKIGYFELPVSLLIEPARSRLLRKVDNLFVEKLKDAMLKNPSSDSAPIVALVRLLEGEEFDASKSNTYEYETIGGNNSRRALQVCLPMNWP